MTDRTFRLGDVLARAEALDEVESAWKAVVEISDRERERVALRDAVARALEIWQREHPGLRA